MLFLSCARCAYVGTGDRCGHVFALGPHAETLAAVIRQPVTSPLRRPCHGSIGWGRTMGWGIDSSALFIGSMVWYL